MLIDNLKGIIFDLDNTLVRTKNGYFYDVIKSTLNEIGYKKKVSMDEACRFWYGINRDREIKKMWDINPEVFWPVLRKYDTVEGRIANTSVFDDVGVLKKLDGVIKKGIFTSSQEKHAFAERNLVEPYFGAIDGFVISGVNGIGYKPTPDGVHECLKLLNSNAKRTAIVGDSALDMMAGEAADVISIFITRENSNLSGFMPNFMIQDLYELFWV